MIIADADDDEIGGPEEDQAETTVPSRPGKMTLSRTVNLAHRKAHRKDIVAVAVRKVSALTQTGEVSMV